MNRPVMIWISKESCPACAALKREWDRLKLDGKYTYINYHCSNDVHLPPELFKYERWYPMILLANPYSFFHVFNERGERTPKDGYEISAKVYSAEFEDGELEYLGRVPNRENINAWADRVYSEVMNMEVVF